MATTYTKWVLTWTFTDIDGRTYPKRRDIEWDEEPKIAFQRKVNANEFLVGGATITEVRLHKVEVTEVWTVEERSHPLPSLP